MLMQKLTSLLLLLPVLVLFSCNKDRITGSGPVQTESRPVAGFTKVEVYGSTNVHVVQGSAFDVQVTAYANLLPYLETRLEDNVLVIEFKRNAHIRNDNSEVTVTLPVLEGLSTNGSGNMDATGNFTGSNMSASSSGSGQISINGGAVTNYDIDISGSGKVKSYELIASVATVHISGSGEAEVHATEVLNAHISGSGNIYYKGEPTVNTTISGSGKVIKK